MNKLEQAARQALDALDWLYKNPSNPPAYILPNARNALREALAEQESNNEDKYLVSQMNIDVGLKQKVYEAWSHNDMAYRPGGLSIDQEQESNSIFMEGYRIGLAEMREKCAEVCEEIEQDRWNLYKGRPPHTGSESGRADPHEQGVSMGAGECAAAIRDINFEGDTGFRPVSEMIAEHKQDPKKKAAIERAELRKATRTEKIVRPGMYKVPAEQAEQEPIYISESCAERGCACHYSIEVDGEPVAVYSAPVRTKDLTDDEIDEIFAEYGSLPNTKAVRAVIAADREKNK